MRVIQKGSNPLHWKDAFKKDLMIQDLSPATVKAYMYDISVFERWYQQIDFKELQLSAITSKQGITPSKIRKWPLIVNCLTSCLGIFLEKAIDCPTVEIQINTFYIFINCGYVTIKNYMLLKLK